MIQLNNSTNELFPGDSPLFIGALVADVLHGGDLSNYLRGLTIPDLAVMAEHIIACEYAILPDAPSWWMVNVLPGIDKELDRRCRPKPVDFGNSPLARLKALDLAAVAGRYTQLRRAGPAKLKGRCPLHRERTPSFFVYEESQWWRCFGACATGGDVISLLAAMRRRKAAANV